MKLNSIWSRGKAALGSSVLLALSSTPAWASSSVLKQDDFVGISFWLISMALIASTAFFFLERDRVSAKWKTSLTVSGLVTLIAFTVYFCGMHSLRHLLRTQQYVNLPVGRLLWICLLPMLGVSALVALGWLYLPTSSYDSRLLQFVFVTLAALTVPHMLLVDRARYAS